MSKAVRKLIYANSIGRWRAYQAFLASYGVTSFRMNLALEAASNTMSRKSTAQRTKARKVGRLERSRRVPPSGMISALPPSLDEAACIERVISLVQLTSASVCNPLRARSPWYWRRNFGVWANGTFTDLPR